MAGENSQERTEQATPKRLQEAAEQGQIARSRELTTLAMLLGAAGSLLILGSSLLDSLAAQMRSGFMLEPRKILDSTLIPVVLAQTLMDCLLMLAPFLAIMTLISLLAPLALGGWIFSSQSLGFRWERVSPIKGIGRLFSRQALLELLKALAKFIVVAGVAVAILWVKQPELLHLGDEPLLPALAHTAEVLGWLFLLLVMPMLLIAGLDVPLQLFEHARQLRMTRQEVTDELKETEGKPEVKARIRRLQQEFAQRRMMEKVPAANLIIANPSHYAVALRYEQYTMSAPVVVAKGADLLAQHIRKLASSHNIPQVESPLLARALYFNSELDKPIPVSLYVAVAQVLAYVYQLRQEDRLETKPVVMTDVPVPPELRTQ